MNKDVSQADAVRGGVKNLYAWMRLATTEEQEELATAAGTSRLYLYQLASDNPTVTREASPDLARRIELAAEPIRKRSKRRLPKLLRTDLNSACRACEFAQRCLGREAVASEFRIVPDEGGDE